MSRLIQISQGWDFARYGSTNIEWNDTTGGPNNLLAPFSSGRYLHPDLGASLSHPSTTPLVTVSITNPYTQFAAALQTAMDAGGGDTFQVTWDPETGRYTIEADSGNFDVTWTGAAQLRMRNLLGFSGNLSGASTYTSTLCPRFAVEPSIPHLVEWADFVAQPDRIASSQTDAGGLVTLRPNLIPFRTAWRHEYEAVDQVHRYSQVVADTPLWTWSDMWMEGIAHSEWLFFREKATSPHPALDRKFAFQVKNVDFDGSTVKPTRKDMRTFFTVQFDALLRGYA